MFQKFIRAHILTRALTFLCKFAFDHHLRGDARMICPRLPQHGFACHAMIAGQNILNGVVDRMPHMQITRHIGRRDDDREIIILGITGLGGAGLKRTALFPTSI